MAGLRHIKKQPEGECLLRCRHEPSGCRFLFQCIVFIRGTERL